MRFKIVRFAWMWTRPQASVLLLACKKGIRAAGHEVEPANRSVERGGCAVMWGLGHPEARDEAKRLLHSGTNVVSWDLGYWERDTHYRVSINAMHPDKIVMMQKREPRGKLPELSNEYNPKGPVVLVGMGWKSARMYREDVGHWERKKGRELLERFPQSQIIYRPKPGNLKNCLEVKGLRVDTRPIGEVLRGASLVVCRHSNVAIDALVRGVPAETEGGAAAAVCRGQVVDDETRQQFLANLSWFQWTVEEMQQAQAWHAIVGMIEDARGA